MKTWTFFFLNESRPEEGGTPSRGGGEGGAGKISFDKWHILDSRHFGLLGTLDFACVL